ncbi:uncharacterized protein LOC133831934 [Humulus lupulus]|uniref:uncharacterized protein LOC133831934 n=1 Tax=Humulus lupulus TaxID=3486 RepID=UPI002B401DB4|nr:uncharacterized protein LOC133831934 [Humulus lupulus]
MKLDDAIEKGENGLNNPSGSSDTPKDSGNDQDSLELQCHLGLWRRPTPTPEMEIRATSLGSMTDIEKSVNEMVTENNLRLVGLLTPHQDVRESTARSATGGGVPMQHQDVSQPPRRRTMGVAIREPSSTLGAAAAPVPPGKGKQKVSEHPEPILESSYENIMSAEDLFDLYSEPEPAAPPSKKKWSRQHLGESSSIPLTKKIQIADPPTPASSKETTPPPAPIDQTSPPAPVDQTHPPAPVNQPPPTPTDQTPPDQTGEALKNIVLSSSKDRMTKLLRHRRSQEAIIGTDTMEVDQIINRALSKVLSGVLTMSASWRRSGALTAQSEKKNAELLEQKAKLSEELKQHQATLIKAIETKEKYKEASLLNFKEASKLQDDLVISRKETERLEERIKEREETNASNLERCLAHLEEEERARVPASPEISLSMGIDGIDKEIGASVDQQTPQDPPVS